MNTNSLTADSEPIIPALEPAPDALVGGSALLDDDAATHAYWSIFSPHDLSFFNMPLLHQPNPAGPFQCQRALV